jgi:hypothetical protein
MRTLVIAGGLFIVLAGLLISDLFRAGPTRALEAAPGNKVELLEARIALLETQLAGCKEFADDDALVQRLNRVLWKTGVISRSGETEAYVLRKLRRIDGLLSATGGGAGTRGWWCDQSVCGRTLKECADTTVLTMPAGDPRACRPARRAWCRDKERLACEPAPCADCTPVE